MEQVLVQVEQVLVQARHYQLALTLLSAMLEESWLGLAQGEVQPWGQEYSL